MENYAIPELLRVGAVSTTVLGEKDSIEVDSPDGHSELTALDAD